MKKNQSVQVKVAIIGAGPAGIGAAIELAKHGIKPLLVIERREETGGTPALYKNTQHSLATFAAWSRGRMLPGEVYAQNLRDKLAAYDVRIRTRSQVLEIEATEKRLTFVNPEDGYSQLTAEAVIMACGAREKSLSERGWVSGSRPVRVFFSKHLPELFGNGDFPALKNPLIIGSDLIAYAAAAKLKAAVGSESILIDTPDRPRCSLPERIYFLRWGKATYKGAVNHLEIIGNHQPTAVKSGGEESIPCDGIIVSGELVPNSELALLGNLQVQLPSRRPVLKAGHQLSAAGWFAAGNILGGFHGAEWCYFNGRRVGKAVVKYLEK
jgi:NADPH-dependent 2,4-dienoyl-CoA reductase/sulfur reductase-like enzyme